jgi:hypothetical protein
LSVDATRAETGGLPQFLRKHALFLVVLGIGIVVRTVVVVAYQPALLLQRDTYAYLERALAPSPEVFRPAIYPIVLQGLLPFDNLTVVVVVQHLVALVLGVLIYVALRRLTVDAWLAALGSAPILLDAYQIDLEHFILAETFFELFAIGAVLLLVWWFRPPLAAVAGAGLLVAAATFTRYAGLGLIVPVLLFVVVRRGGWQRIASLVVAFAVPALVYSLWSQSETGGSALTNRNGFFLYGRVASFADCTVVDVPPRLQKFCFEKPPSERGPSYGFFTLDLPKMKPSRANAQLLSFSLTMIRNQPLGYAGAVGRDFLKFLGPTSPLEKEHYVKRWRFVQSIEEADPHPLVLEMNGSPPPALGIDQEFSIDRSLASRLSTYQDYVYMYGPILGLLLLVGTLGGIFGAREDLPRRFAAGLFTLSAVVLWLLPVMVTVYHFRYVIPGVPLAGMAGATGAACLLTRFRRTPTEAVEPSSTTDSGDWP